MWANLPFFIIFLIYLFVLLLGIKFNCNPENEPLKLSQGIGSLLDIIKKRATNKYYSIFYSLDYRLKKRENINQINMFFWNRFLVAWAEIYFLKFRHRIKCKEHNRRCLEKTKITREKNTNNLFRISNSNMSSKTTTKIEFVIK